MKNLILIAASFLILAGCGSDNGGGGNPAVFHPQLNSNFLGNWRTKCTGSETSSVQSDVTISANGTVHSADSTYANPTCAGSATSTGTTDMRYGVTSLSDSQVKLQLSEFAQTPPPGPGGKVLRLDIEVNLVDSVTAKGKAFGGSYETAPGVPHEITPEEAALIPAYEFTRI